MPPFLAGRKAERQEFVRLLDQSTVLENFVLTGLRGVGKTVLLDSLRPEASDKGWLWVGTDLSESASVSEDALAHRLITDLAVITSGFTVKTEEKHPPGFAEGVELIEHRLSYQNLRNAYDATPGLAVDKLKAVLELAWWVLSSHNVGGVVFAYDEAQTISDHAAKEQYPLSLLLDAFQSIQRKGVPFMLVLAGLPTLFPRLVEARTFAERMFRVVFLDRLSSEECREAILKPIKSSGIPFQLTEEGLESIVVETGGYPYFIQFICREAFDLIVQQIRDGAEPRIPMEEITRKLDNDFFAGRWSRVTERQRDLLFAIARLKKSGTSFSLSQVVDESKLREGSAPFSASQVGQMLSALSRVGLVYKNKHGSYSFAVPMLERFIRRQAEEAA